MLDAELYIACLDLTDRKVLVVGDGPMANEKVEGLRACGAAVEAVSPDAYGPEMLDGKYLVMVATSDDALNRRVFEDAEERSMLVNVADVPDLCNFILPAIARRGPLAVAISTSGASPALAKRMKREVAEKFDDAYARLAELLDELRPWAKETLPDYAARRDFFDALVNATPDPIELLRAGDEGAVRQAIDAARKKVEG
jgi:siroheme synthase-like protein